MVLRDRNLDSNGESILGVRARVSQLRARTEDFRQRRCQRRECRRIIRRQQPVISDDQQFIHEKSQPPRERGFLFKQCGALPHRLQGGVEVAFHARSGGLLAKIGQAEFPFSHIRAEVSFVRDEQNTRAILDMAVVVDIDEQVPFNRLPLDPRVENRDEVLHADRRRICRKEFDAESMEFHYFWPRSLRMS